MIVLLALLAQAASPDGLRIKDEGVQKGFVDTLDCVGSGILCTVTGGKATVTVGGGGYTLPAATATVLGGIKGNGSTTSCSGTDKMTGWAASGAMVCAADQAGSGSPGGVSGNLQTNDGAGGFGAYGGSGTCSASNWMTALSASGVKTCSQPAFADLSGTATDAQLANAYSGTGACAAHKFASTLSRNAAPTCTQPDYSDLTGTPTLQYQTLQEEGTSVTQRATANFIGPAITVADDAVNSKTKVTVVASGIGACSANQYANTLNDGAAPTCSQVAYSQVSGTPTIPADISGASYITKVAEASLSNEFALGSLATGILKNTTTTGVPTIAVSGTDYAPATSGSVLLLGNGSGGFSNYGGASSCTNQFFTGLSSAGASTCTTATLASAQFANQGTTTQVLHGNAAGNPSWAAVSMTADVSGILPLANGGTNKNNTAADGAVAYSDASGILLSAVGVAGQGWFSQGTGAPLAVDAMKVVRLTSDYTNSTTTLSNTALTWTSPAQVSRSAFMCELQVKTAATTTGLQLDVSASVAPTTITYHYRWISAAGTAPSTGGTSAFVDVNANQTLVGPAAAGLTAYSVHDLYGFIVHTSSSSTVTVRAKSGVSASAVTIGSGSFCNYYVL